MRPRTATPPAIPALDSIHSDELLPLRVFRQRLGIGRKAWAALARRGFPVIRCSKQGFIDGAAALAFVRGLGEQQSGNRNEEATSCDNMFCLQQLNLTINLLGTLKCNSAKQIATRGT